MNDIEMLHWCINLAKEKHRHQRDKGGHPYIFHPIRVARRCKTIEEKTVAIMHDLIEDTDVTPEFLIAHGIPSDIVEAVKALTRNAGEEYMDFVERCSKNSIARCVKIADLTDNLDLSRLKSISDNDLQRVEKYKRALAILKEIDEDDAEPYGY